MEDTQDVIVMNADTGILYQQDKAQIDMQIATAKAYPRNMMRAVENAVAVVTMDRETAESCNYALPRGNKVLQGPTINMAKIILQFWGNMRIDAKVVSIDGTHINAQGIAWDLESNVAVQLQVKRSIMQNEWKKDEASGKSVKTGKMLRMNDDMITVTGNAGNSIAMRNAIFAVIPKAVVNKVYAAAKAAITGDISDEQKFSNRRKEVFDRYRDTLNVTEEEVLKSVGKESVVHITPDDLVALIGFAQSIKDGDATVESIFRSNKGEGLRAQKTAEKEDQLLKLWEEKKDKLAEADFNNVNRIVSNKETASYSKAIRILQQL